MSLKSAVLLFTLLTAVLSGCKEEEKPEPRQIKLIVYTYIDQDQFDRIEVTLDNKVVGNITTPDTKTPGCTSAPSPNALYIPVNAGTHTWSAKQYKGGEMVGEWTDRQKEADGENCSYIQLAD